LFGGSLSEAATSLSETTEPSAKAELGGIGTIWDAHGPGPLGIDTRP
jgi:hypothetical protein